MTEKEIIQSVGIPSIPATLSEILRIADDPRKSARDLEPLVMREPALAGQILKLANSSFFGANKRADSIQKAIAIMGSATVKSLAAGLVLIDSFQSLPNSDRAYSNKILKHCVACSGLVSLFLDQMSPSQKENAVLAALTHDLGHIVLYQHFGDRYKSLTEEQGFPSIENERKILEETDHLSITIALLTEWKFSNEVIDLVSLHHQPPDSKSKNLDSILAFQLADLMTESFDQIPTLLSTPWESLDEPYKGLVTLSGLDWGDVFQSQAELIETTVKGQLATFGF